VRLAGKNAAICNEQVVDIPRLAVLIGDRRVGVGTHAGRAHFVDYLTAFGNSFRWRHVTGLDFSAAAFGEIMTVDPQAALQEAEAQKALFDDFGDRLPAELENQRQDLKARLGK